MQILPSVLKQMESTYEIWVYRVYISLLNVFLLVWCFWSIYGMLTAAAMARTGAWQGQRQGQDEIVVGRPIRGTESEQDHELVQGTVVSAV